MTGPVQRIVICGGGAGGLPLAVALAGQRHIAVSLIDPMPTHVWKPLLHEIAAGTLEPAAHEIPYAALARWRGFVFAQGRLLGIDRSARRVDVGATRDEGGREIIPERQVAYDVLVMAVGGVTSDFAVPGVAEFARRLDTVEDARRIHDRILHACMRANHRGGTGERLSIVIVGGGATGVELAAELRSMVRAMTAYGFDRLDIDRFVRLTVVNADRRLLQQLPERLSRSIEQTLRSLEIEVRNGSQVLAVEPAAVVVAGGERIASDLTIWAAGVKAPAMLRGLAGLETNRNDQLIVTDRLQTSSDPLIYAMGDCAAAPRPGDRGNVPPRAQAAYQQAAYLGRAIPRRLAGKPVGPFRYSDLGSLVSLGEGRGVGTLMGFVRGAGLDLDGWVAGVVYRWLYRRHLAGLLGWWAVTLDAIGQWMRRTTRPRVKLH